MVRARRLAILVALLIGAVAPADALGLTIGFDDQPALTGDTAAARNVWIPRAVSEGAGVVRVSVNWAQVAPGVRPRGFSATDPASPGYSWTALDAAVRNLTSRGIQPLFVVGFAPGWAQGSHKPRSAPQGTWRPNASKFANFATAIARRYNGRFPDPLNQGHSLPRVRYWQPWNEPNLDTYLTPQWTRHRGGWSAASPGIYRQLLNAFYTAVKRVSSSGFVVTAGTAPYGDQPGSERMPPVAFDRSLFCLSTRLAPTSCPNPPHLDALAHHPYGIGGPTWHAFNADDGAVADMYKFSRVLHAAERSHHVLPGGPKRIWVTETSWDSKPPDPHGVPLQTQARWLEQELYVLWHQGVDTVIWQQIVDDPPVPNYASSYQAGLYFRSGKAKPAAVAYRFPFITQRRDSSHVLVWGRAPAGGRLSIEVRSGRRWRVVRRLSVGEHRVFSTTISLRGKATLRGQLGSQTSLTWSQSA